MPMRELRIRLGTWEMNSTREKPKPLILKSTVVSVSCFFALWAFSAARRISEMANTPTRTVRMSNPPFSALTPKVYRETESMGASPTVESIRPMMPVMTPLIRSSSERVMISVREKTVIEKYSQGPNLIAMLARAGEIPTRASRLRMVPQKENTMPTPRAFPAWPFSASGRPSRQVAIEAGVPGIFSRMAEISPPEMPPMYRAIKVACP